MLRINSSQLAKFRLIKRLVIAVVKDVSLPLALSLADGKLSIKEAREISTIILEAVSRELLEDKLLLVERDEEAFLEEELTA